MHTPTDDELRAWTHTNETKWFVSYITNYIEETKERVVNISSDGESLTKDFYVKKGEIKAARLLESVIDDWKELNESKDKE